MGSYGQSSLGGPMTSANYFGQQPLGYDSSYPTPAPQTNALPPTALMLNGTPSPPVTPPSPMAPGPTTPGPAAPSQPVSTPQPSPTLGNGYNAFGQQPLPSAPTYGPTPGAGTSPGGFLAPGGYNYIGGAAMGAPALVA